jgi:glycosyltransferase involved in cell wall biosynthesis
MPSQAERIEALLISQQVAECSCVETSAPGHSEVASKRPKLSQNRTLSTIIRFHKRDRLPLLEEAIFSLAIQSWHDHETVIVIQNGSGEIKSQIIEIINRQPWRDAPRYQILMIEVPEGVDGRSTLLNKGMEQAAGRFLAFLDDDDLIYHHGYTTLIRQLEEGGCAIALGGCRMAKAQYVSNHWYIRTKETPFAWGRTRYDLLRDNFVPIHSYVIDRSRVDPADLYFDDELPPLEDYEFLLRMCAKYDFDFSNLDVPVCEYRIHGLNSLPYDENAPLENQSLHKRAQQLIHERKRKINCLIPISELVELESNLISLKQQKMALESSYEQEKLHEQDRFLNTVARKTYSYFGRFPRLERQLSKHVHSGWRLYKRIKHGHRVESSNG